MIPIKPVSIHGFKEVEFRVQLVPTWVIQVLLLLVLSALVTQLVITCYSSDNPGDLWVYNRVHKITKNISQFIFSLLGGVKAIFLFDTFFGWLPLATLYHLLRGTTFMLFIWFIGSSFMIYTCNFVRYPLGMYSCVAGFVDSGETLEVQVSQKKVHK